jgi:hypothetical protein
LPSGTIGAIHEYAVAIDLLKKGYTVFRSITPNGPCDLACLKGTKFSKIEVTTGHITSGGKIYFPSKPAPYTYDHLAIVITESQEIQYVPPIEQ